MRNLILVNVLTEVEVCITVVPYWESNFLLPPHGPNLSISSSEILFTAFSSVSFSKWIFKELYIYVVTKTLTDYSSISMTVFLPLHHHTFKRKCTKITIIHKLALPAENWKQGEMLSYFPRSEVANYMCRLFIYHKKLQVKFFTISRNILSVSARVKICLFKKLTFSFGL